MNKDLLLIKIKGCTYSKLSSILINNSIYYESLNIKDDFICLKTDYDSYKYLKLLLGDVTILRYYGLNGFKFFLKTHYILIISFLLTYLMLIILSNVIFSIEIVTNNNDLKHVINIYLEENNIKKYKFAKSNHELNKIKESILENNKSTLEWIEIERVGTKYVVNLTERVINEEKTDNTPKDIVASKDALIMYIVNKNGTAIKEVNELVKKGDIIISGNILRGEDVIDMVEARGEIYGEVWYTVTTTVPYEFTEYVKTGEVVNHIYLDLFGTKITLMGKYDTNMSLNETTTLIDKPYLFFKVIKERMELYKYKTYKLTKEEAKKEALKRSDKAVTNKLDMDEYIIDKKVLKINEYSSKIEIEVFYKVYENIGVSKELTIIEEPKGE